MSEYVHMHVLLWYSFIINAFKKKSIKMACKSRQCITPDKEKKQGQLRDHFYDCLQTYAEYTYVAEGILTGSHNKQVYADMRKIIT